MSKAPVTEKMRKRRAALYRALREQDHYRYAAAAQAADAIGHNWNLSLAVRADIEWHIVSAICDALEIVPAPALTD